MIANLVITQTKRQKNLFKTSKVNKTKRFVTYDFVCSFFFQPFIYISNAFFSFFFSFILHVCIELPMSNLQQLAFKMWSGVILKDVICNEQTFIDFVIKLW